MTSVQGTVSGRDGHPLAGASVRLVAVKSGKAKQTNTAEDGSFSLELIHGVFAGSFQLVVSKEGYSTSTRDIPAKSRQEINITLDRPNEQPRNHPAHSGDLVSSLEFISVNYRIPMVVELPQDYPPSVNIPSGFDSARELLTRVVAPFPNITCEWRDGVVLVSDSRLRDARHNFFNIELSSFRMPADVAELRLDLNNAMDEEHGSVPSVRTGVLTPSLQKVKLKQGEILRNVTGRGILVRAAQQTTNLFSVTIFKSSNPKTKQDIEAARISWTIRTIDELSENPTRMRSLAPERN